MPFEFPYTDLHEINLNKFIKAVKNLLGGHGGELLQKQSNIPFDYAWKPVTGLSAVNSVNGMTGNVTLTATDVGAIPNTTPIPQPANNLPQDLGVPNRGTSLKYARMDHVHQMPTASDVGALPVGTTIPLPGLNAPEDLGTAYRGTATRYSREDHVHNMPSASDVGAIGVNTEKYRYAVIDYLGMKIIVDENGNPVSYSDLITNYITAKGVLIALPDDPQNPLLSGSLGRITMWDNQHSTVKINAYTTFNEVLADFEEQNGVMVMTSFILRPFECIKAPSSPSVGDFLVYTNHGWDAVAMSVWQGGSY